MNIRKIWLGMALLPLLFAVVSLAQAEPDTEIRGVLMLPPSIRVVEQEAFLGVSARVVYLPEGAQTIGDYAFADTPNIVVAFIPRTVSFIGKDVFRGANRLTIIGVQGSPAEDWAKAQGYRFVHMNVWMPNARNESSYGRQDYRFPEESNADSVGFLTALMSFETDKSMTTSPKEKPEMYPLDYDFP